MDVFPLIIDGKEVETDKYVVFPDMDKVITDPGLAIALQLQTASFSQKFVFSRLPRLIPKSASEMRYLRDYRRTHGVPKYSQSELDEIAFAKVSIAQEAHIKQAIQAGSRDHQALFNPFHIKNLGATLDDRVEALYHAGLAVKERFEEIREISIKEGVPIKTFDWTWSMFTKYLERETFEQWGETLDIVEKPGHDGGRNYRFREPYGTTCLFTPYNSPLALGILSITSSILAGNATIIKPPSKVPLSTIILGRIFMKSFVKDGLPTAMLQVLTGGGKQMMTRFMNEPLIRAIVWYGDSDTGIHLWSQSVTRRIQMAPELAGSDACLVWGRDVDLEFVAKMIVKGRFLGSGQACLAVKRLLVQEDLQDDLVQLLVKEAERLQVGRPSDPKTDLPPLGLTALYLLVDQINDARAKGAVIRTGGYRCNYTGDPDPAGLFYKPTILTNVTQDMRVMIEEVFAPALPVMAVNSIEQAIAVANASRYGLRSSIFTDDLQARRKWVKEIEAGGVIIGTDHLYFDPYMPHLGGFKDSGIIGAKYFPELLTRMKYVHVGPGVEF